MTVYKSLFSQLYNKKVSKILELKHSINFINENLM